jgi:disulfide bond formation protein DsbB
MRVVLAKWVKEIELIDSIIGLVGVVLILSGTLFIQFFYGEQPCPLCLLQRAAFVSIGLSLLLNVRYGNRVAHWAMVIISTCAGAAVSLRQICLHITSPEGFGSAVLGLHMYTWGLIVFVACIVGSAVMLLVYPEKITFR